MTKSQSQPLPDLHDKALQMTEEELIEEVVRLWEALTPQPMKTAPKNGREILLVFGELPDSECPLVASWGKRSKTWLLVGPEIAIPTKPKGWLPLPKFKGE